MSTSTQDFTMPDIEFPELMNIRVAALYADLSEMRIRTLLREGRLKADKNEQGHWVISKTAIDEYNETKGQRGGGPRGEGKLWVIRVKHADIADVREALEPFGIELQPRYNYEKQAEYRKKRAARLKAEKAAATKADSAKAGKAPAKSGSK